MKLVNIVRGIVAWLLLWPLDLVDYFSKDFYGFVAGHSIRSNLVMAVFMLVFYGSVAFCVYDILCLTVFKW